MVFMRYDKVLSSQLYCIYLIDDLVYKLPSVIDEHKALSFMDEVKFA